VIATEGFLQLTQPLGNAFLLVAAKGSILAANAPARALFGIAARPDVTFGDLISDNPEKVVSALNLWSSSRQMAPAVFRLRDERQARVIRCDGALIRPSSCDGPAVLLVECIERDRSSASKLFLKLTEQIAALEKDLFEQRERENERLSAMQIAAAMFAHEISNPLNSISTSLQLLELDLAQKNVTDADVTSAVNGASGEIRRLSSLLHEFRSFAQPQAFDLRRTDLAGLVKEVLTPQLIAYRLSGVDVNFEFAAASPVMADRNKMKQAILNLCKNAFEAMPDGGRLQLKTYRLRETVVLEVMDTGVGTPPGVDIFELFRTGKPGGSGLGLPLVRQIISAHGGTVEYTANPTGGTTFRISLPPASGPSEIPETDGQPSAAAASAQTGDGVNPRRL
jgi:signal transduction histidine kinase